MPLSAKGTTGHDTGGVASIFVLFFIVGLVCISRSLPFGLALGVSRRSYYAGTALLGVAFAAIGGLVLTAAQAIERATGGWGESMHFFRVPYVLDGPWYLTWLTSFVTLALMFIYGMWFGIVYRRWNLIGTMAFIAHHPDPRLLPKPRVGIRAQGVRYRLEPRPGGPAHRGRRR